MFRDCVFGFRESNVFPKAVLNRFGMFDLPRRFRLDDCCFCLWFSVIGFYCCVSGLCFLSGLRFSLLGVQCFPENVGISVSRRFGASASRGRGALAPRRPGVSASRRLGVAAPRHRDAAAFRRFGGLLFFRVCVLFRDCVFGFRESNVFPKAVLTRFGIVDLPRQFRLDDCCLF